MPAKKGAPSGNKFGLGGRPVRYDEKFIEEQAADLEKWMELKENIFIEDFCLLKGYGFQRISEWVKENQKLSDAYEKFQMKQKVALFKGGLSKKFAYPMCALILAHSHNVVAKTEQKFSGDSQNPLSFLLKQADGQSKNLVNPTEENNE